MFDDSNFKTRYVEYGKRFIRNGPKGATDWMILSYSDSNIRENIESFKGLLKFPKVNSSSLFTQGPKQYGVGNVSVALLELNKDAKGFLYAQIQRRREDEFNPNSILHRVFNQIRFTYLSENFISAKYKLKLGLYTGLLMGVRNNGLGEHIYRLKNYFEPDEGGQDSRDIKHSVLNLNQVDQNLVRGIVNALIAASEVHKSLRQTEKSRKRQSILVVKPGLNIFQKLQLIDAIQYYVLPVLGVITFSLDYVTDNANIALRFYDTHNTGGAFQDVQYFYTDDKLKSVKDGYYEIAVELEKEGLLYDDVMMRYYLAGEAKPQDALPLFRIIEKGELYTPDDLRKLLKYPNLVRDRLKPKFALDWISNEKTPSEVILFLLTCISEKTKKNFAEYIPFHIALPIEKRKETNLNLQIITLFQDTVRNSSPDTLEKISNNNQPAIYQELLLNRYAISGENKKITKKPVLFGSGQQPGISILQALLQQPNKIIFVSIQEIIGSQDSTGLLNDLVTELEHLPVVWKPELLYLLWKTLNTSSFDLYLIILKLLIQSETNLSELIKDPKGFKNYLGQGRGLLRITSIKKEETPGISEHRSTEWLREAPLLPRLEKSIVKKVRETCLRISVPGEQSNVWFAEWWFFAELGYANDSVILEDYRSLVQIYSSAKTALEMAKTPEFKFIISRGHLESGFSLRDACKESDGNTLADTTNEALFNTVLQAWIDMEQPIPSGDLAYLIMKLPEANELLAKIAMNETQASAMANIYAVDALSWIKKTVGVMRQPYQTSEGRDLLFERLTSLTKPDAEFSWQMLVEEEASYPKGMQWSDYLKLCDRWKARMEITESTLSVELQTYFDLAQRVTDPRKNGSKNRHILKILIRTINTSVNPARFNLDYRDLKGLYIYAHVEQDEYIQQTAASILRSYLTTPDLANRLDRMPEQTLKALLLHAKKNGLDSEVIVNLRTKLGMRPEVTETTPAKQEIITVEPIDKFPTSEPNGVLEDKIQIISSTTSNTISPVIVLRQEKRWRTISKNKLLKIIEAGFFALLLLGGLCVFYMLISRFFLFLP